MRVLMSVIILFMMLLGCSGENPKQQQNPLGLSWEEVLSEAKGSTVRFYMYGGFAHVNNWIDTYVAHELKEHYGIKLVRVPMDASIFVNKLLTEKEAGKTDGSIDLVWINGENFKRAKQAGILFGPYAEKLPNYSQYVDKKLAGSDFGFPVEGYETPYGRAQFVFEYDSGRTVQPPVSFADLPRWVRKNPGRFTYPQPPDFTGSAFIRQAFYAVTGGAEQYLDGWDEALFAAKAPLLWKYLDDLKPFLWQKGMAYPKSAAELDTLFARGEVDINMSYHPMHAQSKILEGAYLETVRTLTMREGSIYNLHFTAIPANASNKAGAMVVANFLMSPAAQLSKLQPQNWGDFPAIDLKTVTEAERIQFSQVDLGLATLHSEELSQAAVPEIPAEYLEALEKGWEKHVR